MKKNICLILVLTMLLSLCAACGNTAPQESPAPAEESDTITITDHGDNVVTLPKNIERIAIVGIYPLASVISVFFNSADKLVAIPKQSMSAAQNGLLGQVYPEILNAQTECVSGDTVNTEELMSLNPDVVFYSDSDTAIGESLRAAGFNAVAVSVNKWHYDCIETLNNWIALLDEIFPDSDKSEAVQNKSEEIYSLVQERVSTLSDEEKARVFVLFQYTDSNMLTSGQNFFGQWWCDAIGAVNVANELEKDNASPVNMEQVYAWNPDVILVTNFTQAMPDDLYNSTVGSDDWSGISAIQNNKVYKLPLGLYRSYTPGADVPVSLIYIAKTVYPDLFEDIDVTAIAKEYYSEVFGLNLTDEQIESIFKPVSAAASGF